MGFDQLFFFSLNWYWLEYLCLCLCYIGPEYAHIIVIHLPYTQLLIPAHNNHCKLLQIIKISQTAFKIESHHLEAVPVQYMLGFLKRRR